ncbi:unnamed protein product, partial [Aureobasidium pullulans]
MSTSSPYKESEIISLIAQYYHLLFQLHYIFPSSVSFPPPTGRILNLQLCHSISLTPAVISLMQHLPCPCDEGIMLEHDIFIPGSFANSFVNDRFVKLGRDPEIDTIRVCEFNGPVDEEDDVDAGKELRYDFDPACPSDHYTRFPVRDLVAFLQGCVDKIKRLEWIPRKIHGMGVISTGGIEILIEEYGWPNNFKQEAWEKIVKEFGVIMLEFRDLE